MSENFVHLHVHSHYSMMHGVSSVNDLCRAAVRAGFKSLAVTDINGLYGAVNFLTAAGQYGIRPILGTHLRSREETAVILARTSKGYEILSEIITRRHMGESFSPVRDFPECPDDLAVLSENAEILKALRSRAETFVEAVAGPASRRALAMARELGIPPVATNAVHFAEPTGYALHRLARAIDLNKTLSTLPPEEVTSPDRWLKSAEDMAAHFPSCPEALANAARLAHRCHTDWDRFHTVFPSYGDRGEDHFALLEEKCREGIRRRYGKTDEAIEKRLAEELELIRAKGFVDYFLVVNEIVGRRAIHCGRGSAAASLVGYLLGITHVDPIRHNLLFGRFLNPERKDPPDIDVDFPWDERDGLFEELRGYYGPERMAHVANHTGLAARAAVRETAKVYGIPAAEIKEVTRRINFWAHPSTLREHIESHPKFQDFPLDPPWPEVIRLAGRLESLPRNLSTHCGGIILAPDRVTRYVPVQRSAKGAAIIQWEKDQTETAGLVKIDLLGNRSLAVIRDTLAAVGKNTGKHIDYASLNPIADPATQGLLERGETMGVFYVESPAMRQLQQKTRRGDFDHLVIHSSIIRPAANRCIQEYVRRLHGEPYEPLHPDLAELLQESYGIMVYQEHVVQTAMILAGFSWGEADGLRKVISKKSIEQISDYRQRFLEGCARRGISLEVAAAVWGMFRSFAGYSFCKPHSASYALVSFKSAYLKVHHPAEFMAAVLSNEGGYYSTFAYVSESRRMGLEVVGPDINRGDWNWTGKGKSIRMGFQQLKDIHKETMLAVLEERKKNGPFLSLDDLARRVRFTQADGSVLVKSGSLDCLAPRLNRPQMLWTVQALLQQDHSRRSAGMEAQRHAFPSRTRKTAPPALPDFTPAQKRLHEKETLGFLLSIHPLKLAEPFIRGLSHRIVAASDLSGLAGRRAWTVGWPITRKEVFTKQKESMEFISFEDTTAIYETVFFPAAFRRFCREVDMNRAYLLYGDVQSEFGATSLNVLDVKRMTD